MLVDGLIEQPICPVANAKIVNSYLPDSRLIIQDGPGVRPLLFRPVSSTLILTPIRQHCSLAQTSLCTGKVLREYFLEGILPENGKICPVTEIVFPPKPPVNNGTLSSAMWATSAGEEELMEEDVRLLEKLKAFGEAAQEDMSIFKGM